MMAKKNSINNETGSLTVDPGSSGDSYIQFDINGTNEFIVGVDDSDSDKFKISLEGTLGATDKDTFVMTAAGERTMPLQPAFLAYLGSVVTNTTGAGTTWTLGTTTALTQVFDQNDDFNTNGTFTAPVTGIYLLTVLIRMDDLTAAMTDGYIEIVTTNRTYAGSYISPGAARNNNNQCSFTLTTLADMSATHTATVQITISNGAGDTADSGGSASVITSFSGTLIC
jgi:hypothetical protein